MSSEKNPQGIEIGDRVHHKWDYEYDRLSGTVIAWRRVAPWNADEFWASIQWDDGRIGSGHVDDLVKLSLLEILAELE